MAHSAAVVAGLGSMARLSDQVVAGHEISRRHLASFLQFWPQGSCDLSAPSLSWPQLHSATRKSLISSASSAYASGVALGD